MGKHFAAAWHWSATALAFGGVCALGGHWLPALLFTLLCWHIVGLFGHYILRHLSHDG